MNNIFITIFMLLSTLYKVSAQSVKCNQMLNTTIDQFGELTLNPNMVLQGSHTGFDSLWLDSYYFDCLNIGNNTVTAYGINSSGIQSSCTCNVVIEDKLVPVPLVVNSHVGILDSNDTYTLTQSDIDLGSYDNCDFSMSFTPNVITCGMPNPTLVKVTVTDDSGNSVSELVNVYYEETFNDPLVCNSTVTINIPENSNYEVSASDILEGPMPGDCPFAFWIELVVDGVVRPDNTLYHSDSGKPASIIVHGGGNTCWSDITITSSGCSSMLTESMVNFPNDVPDYYLDTYCEIAHTQVTPEYMFTTLGIDFSSCFLTYNSLDSCLLASESYSDFYIVESYVIKIIRTWTVLEWTNNTVVEKMQVIKLYKKEATICDTLPWNTPIGDCLSGHTDQDIVEWPADITVNTSKIIPSHLAINSTVNANDVKPIMDDDLCLEFYVEYEDNLVYAYADTTIIERKWAVFVFPATLGYYTQRITAIYDNGNVFCVYRKNGDPIPDVTMAPGFITDATGCVDMTSYTGDIVSPEKISPALEGVDIFDLVEIRKIILATNYNNCQYTNFAGDMNGSGSVSPVDQLFLENMIEGNYTPDPTDVWSFYDVIDGSNDILVSENNPLNTFIGVKLGDLDNSFDLLNGVPGGYVNMVVKDEVLIKGQNYKIPLLMSDNEKFTAFRITFDKSEDIGVVNYFAPMLPGFSSDENVIETSSEVTIQYEVPDHILQLGGLSYDPSLPLLSIVVRAKNNGILSESLNFSNTSKSLIKTERYDQAASIILNFNEVIINKVEEEVFESFAKFYPNPTSDFINIDNVEYDSYQIYDFQGKLVQKGLSNNNNQIDVSNLNNGLFNILLMSSEDAPVNAKFIRI